MGLSLSDGRKSFPIGLAVLIQYRSLTASQPRRCSYYAQRKGVEPKNSTAAYDLESHLPFSRNIPWIKISSQTTAQSLTSLVSKTIECTVKDCLTDHLF